MQKYWANRKRLIVCTVWVEYKRRLELKMKRFSFPKNKRLLTDKQFKAVLNRRLTAADGLLKLFMAENHRGYPRLGVSVGKAYGGAVVRNRLKRLIREAFRLSRGRIPADFDYLVMISPQWTARWRKQASAKKAAGKLGLQDVRASLMTLVEKLMGKGE